MAYTIGKLAKLAGISTVTIRYYEKTGLIEKGQRLENSYRFYQDDTLKRLGFIKNAQLVGFSLNEIKELLSLKANETLSASDIKNFVRKKIDLIDLKIQALHEVKSDLSKLYTLCNGKVTRKDCPILQALSSCSK